MLIKDFSTVLAAWLRLPNDDVSKVMASLKRSGIIPGHGPITALGAAKGIIGLMVASVEGVAGVADGTRDACGMLLEAPHGVDPLDVLPRTVFSGLVGQTLGKRSANGYVDFSETLATAMTRVRSSLGTIELERVAIRTGGTDPVGLVEVKDMTGSHVFPFTRAGSLVPRTGIIREVSVDRAVLQGIAFLMDAENVVSV